MKWVQVVVLVWGVVGLLVYIDFQLLGHDHNIAWIGWGEVIAASMLFAASADVLFPKNK